MEAWRIIRGAPPRELYGGELLDVREASTGNAALEAYANASGRVWERVNNDRIQFRDDPGYTLGFLNVKREWSPNGEADAPLRSILGDVAETYDVAAHMSSPAQKRLRGANQSLARVAPVGFVIKGSGGGGGAATVPWIGFLDPDETTTPHEGLYLVYLFGGSRKTIWLTLIQGITSLYEQMTPRLARVRLAEDGASIRAAVPAPLLEGLTATVDLEAGGRLPQGYTAGAVVALRYDAAELPPERELRDDFDRFVRIYAAAVAAKRRLLVTSPGMIATKSKATEPESNPLEDFKPKDSSEYRARLTGGVVVRERRHEALVKSYGEWAISVGFRASTAEHPIDLMIRDENDQWLLEAEVIRRGNAAHAVREAIGQLFEYRRFYYGVATVKPTLVALFSEDVGQAYLDLLEELGIEAIWRNDDEWWGSAQVVASHLARPPLT